MTDGAPDSTEGSRSIREFMDGWPTLWPLRWSSSERRSFYETGIWTEQDLWRAAVEIAQRQPAAEAYTDQTERLRWGELTDHAAAFARGLMDRGVGAGDVVAVQLPNWVEFPIVRFGVSAVGGILLTLPSDVEPHHTESLLRTTGVKALVTATHPHPDIRNSLASPRLVITVRNSTPSDLDLESMFIGGHDLPKGGDSDSIDLLMGTSGTTGTPKIVMRTPNSFSAMSRSLIQRIGFDNDDVLMVTAPLSQGIGYMHGIVEAALTGCRVLLLEELKAQRMLQTIERERVTIQIAVPTLAIRLLALPALAGADVGSLRVHLNGGALLPRDTAVELEERLQCRILNLYGSLDVGVATMTSPKTDPPAARHSTVGRVVEGTRFRVVDPNGDDVRAGHAGEIVVRGANTAIGYFADPDGTARAFDPEGWGHLGDVGELDEAGYLKIVGRLKDVIIRGGRNVSAPEVEGAAREHPAVLDAAAVPYPDRELGERCALFVVLREDTELSLADVTAFFEARGVTKYKWPERLEIVSELPMDSQGKIRKAELRQLLGVSEGVVR